MGALDSVIDSINTAAFGLFGTAATYVPATGEQFAVSVIQGDFVEMDQIRRSQVQDLCTYKLRHSELEAQSILEPVGKYQSNDCDRLLIPDQNGTAQTWSILEKRFRNGVWTLLVERNTRITQ